MNRVFVDIDPRTYNIAPQASNTVRRAISGIDYVLHQAALPSVLRSVADPHTTHEVNATRTLNILWQPGISVFAAWYSPPRRRFTEIARCCPSAKTCHPAALTLCSIQTGGGDLLCGIPCRLRLTLCGPTILQRVRPRQDPQSQYSAVIPKFTTLLQAGKTPVINGDGPQSRNFTFVDNVVEANLLACEQPQVDGQVINVACGEQHSLLELYQELAYLTGRDLEPSFTPERVGDVKHSLASVEKAGYLLGYHPLVSWQEDLRRTIAWYA